MREGFKLEIVNPESSFLSKEGVSEVVVPAFEGDMGILKDHISIISFLKPGLVKIFEGSKEEIYYVDDGIVEFKNNCLSILTSNIFDIKKIDKNIVKDALNKAEQDNQKKNLYKMSVSTLGIIGSGQLGSLLCQAAKKLKIKTVIISDDENGPAQNYSDEFIYSKYDNKDKIKEFMSKVDIITYEFENIPTDLNTFTKLS